jgi:hypothetical protein
MCVMLLNTQAYLLAKMRKAQVWIETVLYTLIGLAIIGIILGLVRPAIQEKQDQVVLEQSLDILKGIDNNVQEIIHTGVGNSRAMEISLKKGSLIFNCTGNEIYFEMESAHMYSETGDVINVSRNIQALTIEKAKGRYDVKFSMSYNFNITFEDKDIVKSLTASSTPYNVAVANKGSSIDFLIS